MKDLYQSADWKAEKHAPVIEIADGRDGEDTTTIKVCVGKEIAHPNTTEHHISWIRVYFVPDGEKFPYEVGSFAFGSHGASVQGPNTSTVYTEPQAVCVLKTAKPGTVHATSCCNTHGLWTSSARLTG